MGFKPWLWLPAGTAHTLAPYSLGTIAKVIGRGPAQWKPLDWEGLHFPNPLGIAGGVDKNADQILNWTRLGAGFIEIGTITPEPQTSNPGRIIDRSNKKLSLWNRMGFPNSGLQSVVSKLEDLPKRTTPLFANIGKNRDTKNEDAPGAYAHLIAGLQTHVDAFVINISSPNTDGLRQLLEPANLKAFLSGIILNTKSRKPLLLKLSPDMSDLELISAMDIAIDLGVSGFVISNTMQNTGELFPKLNGGGVSGYSLQKLSEQKLEVAKSHLERIGVKKLLISVGGILAPEDARRRLNMGADLIQVYSALIFTGPQFFQKVAKAAKKWH